MWDSDVRQVSGSTQTVELAAAVHAFELFPDKSLNIIADSAYVTGIVHCLKSAFIREVENKQFVVKISSTFKNKTFVFYCSHPLLC